MSSKVVTNIYLSPPSCVISKTTSTYINLHQPSSTSGFPPTSQRCAKAAHSSDAAPSAAAACFSGSGVAPVLWKAARENTVVGNPVEKKHVFWSSWMLFCQFEIKSSKNMSDLGKTYQIHGVWTNVPPSHASLSCFFVVMLASFCLELGLIGEVVMASRDSEPIKGCRLQCGSKMGKT